VKQFQNPWSLYFLVEDKTKPAPCSQSVGAQRFCRRRSSDGSAAIQKPAPRYQMVVTDLKMPGASGPTSYAVQTG
jgi:hypothetical protein